MTALPLGAAGEVGYRTYLKAAGERLAAQVPGEIHLDLMRAGKMDDPDISDNARARCRWPEQHSWWYRTTFTPPAGLRQAARQQLVFDGIDLFGQVFVNGKLAATSKDTFATLEVDVKDLLRDGVNELVVRVTSGMELAPDSTGEKLLAEQRPPLYAVRSFVYPRHRFLRKPAYNAYGWDWCDPLPNIGIWRGVRLEGRTDVVIHHLRVDTRIRNCAVTLEGEVILENLETRSEIPCVLELLLEPPHGRGIAQRLDMGAQIGRFAVPCRIEVPDPKLWWPNGMGPQPLYRLTARVLCSGRETDRRTQTIGLRTIELVRQALPEGSRFELRVNEQPVYCKGGNWAPADLIPARVDAARYQRLIELARSAGFTMLRVNGVGLYESDAFYEACDRAGILVWQDFTFSDAEYPDRDPEFLALVRNEALSVVRRLRHHASLALWCGNNECTWLIGGSAIYSSELLPDICRAYDPVRAYWPGSPFGGVEPNSETSGDYHWWGKGGPAESADLRYGQSAADACRARFVSEFGALGPPVLASIRQYLKSDELSPESVAWRIHTNMSDTSAHGSAIEAQIRHHYGSPDGLAVPQYLIYGQMCQAILHGRVVEALRFRKGDPKNACQGALVWSYNDTWGEIGWSIVDHYGRRKPSYYWFRRAAAPIKVLVRSLDGRLVTRVVNDTLERYRATVRCGWLRLDGSSSELNEHAITIPSNGAVEVEKVTVPGISERDPSQWLYAAILRGEGIADDQCIWPLAPHRELAFSKPAFSSEVRGNVLEVKASVYCHGVHLDDEGAGVLADNYLDLLPGLSYHVGIIRPKESGRYQLSAVLPLGVRV